MNANESQSVDNAIYSRAFDLNAHSHVFFEGSLKLSIMNRHTVVVIYLCTLYIE